MSQSPEPQSTKLVHSKLLVDKSTPQGPEPKPRDPADYDEGELDPTCRQLDTRKAVSQDPQIILFMEENSYAAQTIVILGVL